MSIETLNRFERMQKIYADGGYRGDELAEKLKKELSSEVIKKQILSHCQNVG